MLEILYQDLSFIAVNKPSGLLVHRSKIDRHETAFALQQVRDQIGQRVYPFHRLDKPTSGVLLFALNPESARLMTEMFTTGKPQKRYLAVVRGYTKRHEVIDYPLNEELDQMSDQNASQNKAAQTAVTHYQCVATVELPHAVGRYQSARYSLIEVTPETGRKHQIRRHMKHIFHPIIGDTTHGDGKHNRLFRNRYDCHRLLLHAAELSFTHPINGERISIEAPLDDTFSQVTQLFQLSKASRG